jgi:hypothetical protein
MVAEVISIRKWGSSKNWHDLELCSKKNLKKINPKRAMAVRKVTQGERREREPEKKTHS